MKKKAIKKKKEVGALERKLKEIIERLTKSEGESARQVTALKEAQSGKHRQDVEKLRKDQEEESGKMRSELKQKDAVIKRYEEEMVANRDKEMNAKTEEFQDAVAKLQSDVEEKEALIDHYRKKMEQRNKEMRAKSEELNQTMPPVTPTPSRTNIKVDEMLVNFIKTEEEEMSQD
jgi:hypothetical protein